MDQVFALGVASIILIVMGSITNLFLLVQFCKSYDRGETKAGWIVPWKLGWLFFGAGLCFSEVRVCFFTLAYIAAAYWCYAAFRFREITRGRVYASLCTLGIVYGLVYILMGILLPYHPLRHNTLNNTYDIPRAEYTELNQWQVSWIPIYTEPEIYTYDTYFHRFLHEDDWKHPVFIGHQLTLGGVTVFTTS